MRHPPGLHPSRGPASATDDGLPAAEIAASHRRNLVVLALHQIVFRVGWIFKTESVIMPAVLDAMAGPGTGWLRGLLPVLSRFGQSVPPVFLSERLRAARRKKWALVGFAGLAALPALAWALLWWYFVRHGSVWVAAPFLACYLLFHVVNGLYLLSFGTVQGKLIRPNRRGLLLLVSTFWGALPATLLAVWLLPGWLESPDGALPAFHLVFAWVGGCFLVAAVVATTVREPADRVATGAGRPHGTLADVLRVLRDDANFRRLIVVAMLAGSGLIVFPHYQALALQRLQLRWSSLMLFAVTQNVAVGVLSVFVGPLADRRGNRLTLRVLIFASAVSPAFAASLLFMPAGVAARLCWLTFVALGVTPLLLRILMNYTLEICPPGDHPRYLSTVSVCLAIPFLLSPLVGWAIDAIGFLLVFLSVACLLGLAGALTFCLEEPRHRIRGAEPPMPGLGMDD